MYFYSFSCTRVVWDEEFLLWRSCSNYLAFSVFDYVLRCKDYYFDVYGRSVLNDCILSSKCVHLYFIIIIIQAEKDSRTSGYYLTSKRCRMHCTDFLCIWRINGIGCFYLDFCSNFTGESVIWINNCLFWGNFLNHMFTKYVFTFLVFDEDWPVQLWQCSVAQSCSFLATVCLIKAVMTVLCSTKLFIRCYCLSYKGSSPKALNKLKKAASLKTLDSKPGQLHRFWSLFFSPAGLPSVCVFLPANSTLT